MSAVEAEEKFEVEEKFADANVFSTFSYQKPTKSSKFTFHNTYNIITVVPAVEVEEECADTVAGANPVSILNGVFLAEVQRGSSRFSHAHQPAVKTAKQYKHFKVQIPLKRIVSAVF